MDADGPTSLLAPTCLAHASPWAARTLLLALLAIATYGVTTTSSHDLVATAGHGEDFALYAAIVDDVRAGHGYYAAAEMRLRQRGYAMSSTFNWRLPTLARMLAALPSAPVGRVLLAALAVLTLLAWYMALRRGVAARPAFLMCLALLGILGWPFLGEAYLVHEAWAGIAIALSIASLALGWAVAGIASGLAALAIRELALPYVLVAMVLSIRRRRRGEATAWLVGVALFGAALAAHAWEVSGHQLPSDRAQDASWLQLGGWWFVLQTGMLNAWLIAAPPALLAVVWPLSLLGLMGWSGPLGRRATITVFVYVACFLLIGLPYNHLWGLLYAGLAPLGLFFTPAVIRDLWCRAMPRLPDRAASGG